MKKLIFVLASFLALAFFVGCSNDSDSAGSGYSAPVQTSGIFTGTVTVGTVDENVTVRSVNVNSTKRGSVTKTETGYDISLPRDVSYRVVYHEDGKTNSSGSSISTYANFSITKKGDKYYCGNTVISVTGSLEGNFTISSIDLQYNGSYPVKFAIPYTVTNLIYVKQ